MSDFDLDPGEPEQAPSEPSSEPVLEPSPDTQPTNPLD